MRRSIISIVLSIVAFCMWAEDTRVVIPTSKDTNYALYPASTGVFLRLDTRDGTILVLRRRIQKKAAYLIHNRLLRTTNQDDLDCTQPTVAGSGFYLIR